MAESDDTLIESATELEPQRPTQDLEDITVRLLSIGFSGGSQDLTLFPEDEMEADAQGNIRISFGSLDGGGEFVAYAGHTQWHSIKTVPFKREVGTKRPDPARIMREFQERKRRNREAKVEKLRAKLSELERED